MKINRWWKFIKQVSLLYFLAQLKHVVIYLLIVDGLLRYFKRNSRDGCLPNPTGPLPVFHHRPSSYTQTATSKLSYIKNLHDMHVHNSLSNVAIHIYSVEIHRVGRYQLEIVFARECLPPIAMGNRLHRSNCI